MPLPTPPAASPSPPAAPERHIRLAGTRNLRDVGGYPAGGGRQTRWRTLFRADSLDLLPPDSKASLLGLGIRQAIDLRWPTEAESSPSVFRDLPDVRYLNLPLRDPRPEAAGGLPASYRRMIDERGEQLAGVAKLLLDFDRLPAVVGCAAGVDRTGLAMAVVLTAIGVPADTVAADYALSAALFAVDDQSGLDDWRRGPLELDCRPEYLLATLDHLDRRHGGVAGFLQGHGLTGGHVAQLRDLLTEPVPNAAH